MYPIVGPDGSAMLYIGCGDQPGRCFQLAGEACPHGYDVWATSPGVQDGILARCKVDVVASAPPRPPPPVASPPVPASRPAIAAEPLPPLRGVGAGGSWVESVDDPEPWPPEAVQTDLPWPPQSSEMLAQPWPDSYRDMGRK